MVPDSCDLDACSLKANRGDHCSMIYRLPTFIAAAAPSVRTIKVCGVTDKQCLRTGQFSSPFLRAGYKASIMSATKSRDVEKIVAPKHVKGSLYRLIGTLDIDGNGTEHKLPEVDPFILLDTGKLTKRGMPPFGKHPHRGHSVVSVLLQGKLNSWDSFAQKWEVMTGPCSYWVDAASGVFHDEKTVIDDEDDETQHIRSFQLWVGVSEEDRSKPPSIQTDVSLPTFECKSSDGKVVGTGRYHVGAQTSITTPHPVQVAHIKQQASTVYKYQIPPDHGGFVVHMHGEASYGGTPTSEENSVVVLQNDENDADHLEIQTTTACEYLICSGERIKEKWYKKLVANGALFANTPEEARKIAAQVEGMAERGKQEGGSFAPFGN